MLYVSKYRKVIVVILAFKLVLDLTQSIEKILLSEIYSLQIWDNIGQLLCLSEISK